VTSVLSLPSEDDIDCTAFLDTTIDNMLQLCQFMDEIEAGTSMLGQETIEVFTELSQNGACCSQIPETDTDDPEDEETSGGCDEFQSQIDAGVATADEICQTYNDMVLSDAPGVPQDVIDGLNVITDNGTCCPQGQPSTAAAPSPSGMALSPDKDKEKPKISSKLKSQAVKKSIQKNKK